MKDCLKKNNIKDIQFLKYLVEDSYIEEFLDNTFCVFKSINNLFYLIYATDKLSIICYNLIDNKKLCEIKNAHKKNISNFRNYLDKTNNRDLIISISYYDNNLKLWNINNLECLINIKKINKIGFLYSACFLYDNNQIYIASSNFAFGGTYVDSIKIFDLNGINIQEINDSNYDTYFIDIYYDNKFFKNYIITGNYNYVKSYDYNNNKTYYKYYDKDSYEHISINIIDIEKIVKLIESGNDGNIRIWNFHSGELLNKINISNGGFLGICIWNNDYLFLGNKDNIIIIELKSGTKIKIINKYKNSNNNILSIKKIILPYCGECLISQEHEDNTIKLWKSKI